MPTKTRRTADGGRRRRPKRKASKVPDSQRRFAERLAGAMRIFFVAPEKLEAELIAAGLAAGPRVADVMGGRRVAISWFWALAAAEFIGVDPRWLITGKPSPAASWAINHFAAYAEDHHVPVIKDPTIRWLLETIPQPYNAPGQCRYCGCTDSHGCGDCEWVDADRTICSACLDPEGRP